MKPLFALLTFIGTVLAPATGLAGQVKSQVPKRTPHSAAALPAVSPAFKRIMAAAIDPTSTIADVQAYTRDARLQIQTKQDGLLFAKFLIASEMYDKARADDSKLSREEADVDETLAEYTRLVDAIDTNSPDTSDIKTADRAERRLTDAQTIRNQDRPVLRAEVAICIRAAGTIYVEIRAALGLPPIAKTD